MRPVSDPRGVHRLKHRRRHRRRRPCAGAAGLWDTYIEARYRDRALRIARDADGLEYLEIGGQPTKSTRKGYPATLGRMGQKELDFFTPRPDRTYAANMPFGACDADQRLKLLERRKPRQGDPLSDPGHPVGSRARRHRAVAGVLPCLQPLDRRFLPTVRRPAGADRPSVAGRSAVGGGRAGARGEGRLPRRLRRSLHLDAQGTWRSGA